VWKEHRREWRSVPAVLAAALAAAAIGCSLATGGPLQPFPAGYIDSAFVVPDGTALYFIHGVMSTLDILEQNPGSKSVTAHPDGHHASEGGYWWNTDIYCSPAEGDGTWGRPQNLGDAVNSEHMESSPWTNAEQTVLIFTRESVSDPSFSGTFLSSSPLSGGGFGAPRPAVFRQ
jgi:hypothetical protein